MQIFYVNIGGGEPTVRPDFWELVDYATDHHVGVKFSTNGSRITAGGGRAPGRPATTSTCRSRSTGPPPTVNDAVRGAGSYATAVTAMERLADAGFAGFKLSVVVTRHNVGQLDAFKAHRRPLRGPAPADPAAAVRPRRRRLGRAPSHRRPAAGSSTTGWWPTARRCSPATPSSTWPATARPCPDSTCAAPAGWSAWSTRWATSTPAPSPSTTSSWPATCGAPAGSPGCGATRTSSLELRQPAERRGLRFVRPLRRLPGRVHGGQVLHRAAARRSRPRVRPRPRRACRWPAGTGPHRPGPVASTTRGGRGPGARGHAPRADPTGPATRTRWPASSPARPHADPWPASSSR